MNYFSGEKKSTGILVDTVPCKLKRNCICMCVHVRITPRVLDLALWKFARGSEFGVDPSDAEVSWSTFTLKRDPYRAPDHFLG